MGKITYDVFISYSRKDYVDEKNNVILGNEVSKIKEALTKAGITYWFDEEGVYPGDKFAKVIVQNIKASSVFVFLSTKNSNQSEWTASEISTAYMLKKKIIPVQIDDSVFNDDVILYISRLIRIEYFNNPDVGRRELIRSIKAFLEEVKAAEAQKVADEQRRKEELERQRRRQEEEKRLQRRIEKIETEIAALESQKTERKKVVFQKEQELKLAQLDLEACEAKIQKLQKQLQELREPKKKVEEEEKQLQKKINAEEKVFTVGNVSFMMIPVEGGRFQMGAQKTNPKAENYDEEASDGESPVHSVKLDSFYMGETIVTQALWKAVMGSEPSFNGGWEDRSGRGDNYPAYRVSYNEIVNEFIPELNRMTGKNFRLPTEAEWEYAARGSQKNKTRSKYSGSNAIDKVAWYKENSNGKTHPVKERQPNGLGIYDMSGNVGEWCKDWYDDKYYSNSSEYNLQGPHSGLSRVLRGGSWYGDARGCRVSCRSSRDPDSRSYGIGFRLVLPR